MSEMLLCPLSVYQGQDLVRDALAVISPVGSVLSAALLIIAAGTVNEKCLKKIVVNTRERNGDDTGQANAEAQEKFGNIVEMTRPSPESTAEEDRGVLLSISGSILSGDLLGDFTPNKSFTLRSTEFLALMIGPVVAN